jgi:nucleoside-diphosphate-sugar epimerase
MAAARARDLAACSFRLYSVYGPRERPDKLFPTLIRCVEMGEPFPLFEGSERHLRSYTYVDDTVAGLCLALDRLPGCIGQIINLGNDQSVTTAEGIATIEALLGKRALIDRRPRRAGDQSRTHADIEKARRILGYEPTTSLQQGLAHTVAWYRRNPVWS